MGVFTQIPEKYQHFEVLDYTGHMIVPGLSDLHVHAPQYAYRGLGMDMELLEWLETYAFPEESGYKEPAYADKAYSMFVQDLKYSPTFLCICDDPYIGYIEIDGPPGELRFKGLCGQGQYGQEQPGLLL